MGNISTKSYIEEFWSQQRSFVIEVAKIKDAKLVLKNYHINPKNVLGPNRQRTISLDSTGITFYKETQDNSNIYGEYGPEIKKIKFSDITKVHLLVCVHQIRQ